MIELSALAFSAALAQAAAPTSAPARAPQMNAATQRAIAWGKAELHIAGWRMVSASAALLVFVKPGATAPDANPQIFVRGEHVQLSPVNPIGSGESFVNLGEIDCAKNTERTLHATVYSGSDLQGGIVAGADDPSAWTKITPDALIAVAVPIVCGEAHPSSASRPASAPVAPHL